LHETCIFQGACLSYILQPRTGLSRFVELKLLVTPDFELQTGR
jgi:hypothetical protein